MQHDLYANPNRRERIGFPLVVDLQANVADGVYRIVAPLTAATAADANRTGLCRSSSMTARDYAVLFNLMTNLSGRLLRHPVGSVAHYRDDLSRALDWLFFGI